MQNAGRQAVENWFRENGACIEKKSPFETGRAPIHLYLEETSKDLTMREGHRGKISEEGTWHGFSVLREKIGAQRWLKLGLKNV